MIFTVSHKLKKKKERERSYSFFDWWLVWTFLLSDQVSVVSDFEDETQFYATDILVISDQMTLI